MKTILTIIGLFFINLVFCQSDKLTLSIEIISDEEIELIDFKNFRGNITYSFNEKTVLNFENEIIEEYILKVKTKEKVYENRLWLDHGNFKINISLHSNSLDINVIGSNIFDKTIYYKKESKKLKREDATDYEFTRFLFQELNKNIDNPFSYIIGIDILLKNQSNREVLSQLMYLINSQDETLKSHYMSDLLINTLNSKLNSGNIDISNFSFLDINDQVSEILIGNNNFLLLDFWHTACPPCLKDHIEIETLFNEFNKKKVNIISISSDKANRIETWKRYVNRKKFLWTNYIEKESGGLTESLNIRIFPTYILLDTNNDVIAYTNSLEDILSKLTIVK